MEFNEAKIPSRLAQMRPLIHDGEKSLFYLNDIFKWNSAATQDLQKQKQFTF